MPRKSDILKYPEELLAFIDQCLDDPKLTQAVTLEKTNALIRDKYPDEKELTSGSLGRYAKRRKMDFEKASRYMAQQKALRDEFFERFGDEGLDNAGRYAAEMLYSFMMRMQTALISIESLIDDGEIDMGALDLLSKVVQRISTSIGNLEKSLTENKGRVDAIKKEAAEQARKEDVEKLKVLSEQTRNGKPVIDEDTIKRIREEVYGVYT